MKLPGDRRRGNIASALGHPVEAVRCAASPPNGLAHGELVDVFRLVTNLDGEDRVAVGSRVEAHFIELDHRTHKTFRAARDASADLSEGSM